MTPWLRVARDEQKSWDHRIKLGAVRNPAHAEAEMSRDEEYFQAAPFYGGSVKPPGQIPNNAWRLDWCAAFANYCLHLSGHSHTGNAGAHSFTNSSLWWFNALPEPRSGCVVVVGSGNRGQHVAFLWDCQHLPANPDGNVAITGNRVLNLLGGNQSNRINIKRETRTMLAARGRNGIRSPYLWPLRGPANCNHIPPSIAGHFCGNIHP